MATFDEREQVVTTQYNAESMAFYVQAPPRAVEPGILVASERQARGPPAGHDPRPSSAAGWLAHATAPQPPVCRPGYGSTRPCFCTQGR
jgi:hypothetical protein